MDAKVIEFHRLPIPLDRDLFMRGILRDMAEVLAKKYGADKAREFVHELGTKTGGQLNTYYRASLQTTSLTPDQIASAMVDLKRRINGEFYVIELTDEKIVLGNRACPFGSKVLDRPQLCMMTSSVFGAIAAENLGYAKVEVEEAIALRHKECRVVVYLKPTPEAAKSKGREYFAK